MAVQDIIRSIAVELRQNQNDQGFFQKPLKNWQLEQLLVYIAQLEDQSKKNQKIVEQVGIASARLQNAVLSLENIKRVVDNFPKSEAKIEVIREAVDIGIMNLSNY